MFRPGPQPRLTCSLQPSAVGSPSRLWRVALHRPCHAMKPASQKYILMLTLYIIMNVLWPWSQAPPAPFRALSATNAVPRAGTHLQCARSSPLWPESRGLICYITRVLLCLWQRCLLWTGHDYVCRILSANYESFINARAIWGRYPTLATVLRSVVILLPQGHQRSKLTDRNW